MNIELIGILAIVLGVILFCGSLVAAIEQPNKSPRAAIILLCFSIFTAVGGAVILSRNSEGIEHNIRCKEYRVEPREYITINGNDTVVERDYMIYFKR